jgi:hypothetical protein
MNKPKGGALRSSASIVGPAVPVLIGVVLTILLTISPQDASRNFTAWGEALSGLLPAWLRGPANALHPAASAAKAWFNPGVVVVLIGIAVSLATGFATGWLQIRETRKRSAAVVADAIHGELLAKLNASSPSLDGQAD